MAYGPWEFQLETSCADLLLCSYSDRLSFKIIYYICNLLTKQWIALPPIPMDSVWVEVGFLCDSVGCLEYKYRIVRIVETNSMFNVQIFSSEEGQWSKSFIPLSGILNTAKFMKIRMIAYNRMLHILSAHGVTVFDPFHKPPKVCRTIDLPVDLTFSLCTCLGECRGRLRLGVQFGVILDSETDHNKLNVWELEDYNNGKWCWAYKICIKNSVFQGLSIPNDRCWIIQILAFHPNNGNIVYLRIGICIVEYNMQQKKIETSCPIDICSNFSLLKPVTLTHQNWPTTLPSLP
ncbi:putative F-box/kelch-repeat protein [Forsythia ovata]|uniref:F-box/kelch-repeat protein n=1 Tax=Forsythia ovata TaxID=205694 RepID=A0ABD1TPG6_9LAMI